MNVVYETTSVIIVEALEADDDYVNDQYMICNHKNSNVNQVH